MRTGVPVKIDVEGGEIMKRRILSLAALLLYFALLFSLINAFKCFREIFLIGGKHPNTEVYMLQHFMNNNFENLNYNKLSVASVLLFLAVTIVISASYGWVQRKEAYKS